MKTKARKPFSPLPPPDVLPGFTPQTRRTMRSLKARLITALIVASMLPNLLRSQNVDQGVIRTTDVESEWTTKRIVRPNLDWQAAGQYLSIFFQSADTTTADGYWHVLDYSDNLIPFNLDYNSNICGTLNDLDSTIVGEPISIRYMISDTLGGRHGVGSYIHDRIDRYGVRVGVLYTDTATGNSIDLRFRIPNRVYNYIMGLDTSELTPFREHFGFNLDTNPDSLDMVLKGLYDVMVDSGMAQDKEVLAGFNEISPYIGAGDSITSTIEMVCEGGIENPFRPVDINFAMKDYADVKASSAGVSGGGGWNSGVDGLESVLLKTAYGNVRIRYLMPDTTVTYPGAEVVNVYEVTVDSGFMPEIEVYGLPARITMNQLNDTVFDVAVGLQTPVGGRAGVNATYDVSLDVSEVPLVGVGETPGREDFGALNFPNPFLDNTVLKYSLSVDDFVRVEVYDVQGRLVRKLFEGEQKAGTHSLALDGSGLDSGLYFANISTPRGSYSVKIVKQ